MNTFTSRFERAHVSECDRCRSIELGALRWRFRGLSEPSRRSEPARGEGHSKIPDLRGLVDPYSDPDTRPRSEPQFQKYTRQNRFYTGPSRSYTLLHCKNRKNKPICRVASVASVEVKAFSRSYRFKHKRETLAKCIFFFFLFLPDP